MKTLEGRTVAVVTIIAWAVLAADAFVTDAWLNLAPGLSMLVGCIAASGLIIIVTGHRAKPVTEIYEAGRNAGYWQGRTDQAAKNATNNVVKMRKRA